MNSLTLALADLAIAGAVPGFNFLGDAVCDQLDPRTRLEIGL